MPVLPPFVVAARPAMRRGRRRGACPSPGRRRAVVATVRQNGVSVSVIALGEPSWM
jgi:hypothetical protein